MAYRRLIDRRRAVRAWKKKNPDKVRAQGQRFRKRVGSKELARRQREWKKKHPDRVKIYRRRYAKKHRK